jgi:hypothetical protein
MLLVQFVRERSGVTCFDRSAATRLWRSMTAEAVQDAAGQAQQDGKRRSRAAPSMRSFRAKQATARPVEDACRMSYAGLGARSRAKGIAPTGLCG